MITERVKGKARRKRINVKEKKKKTSQTEQSMFLITACKAGRAKHPNNNAPLLHHPK